MRHNTEPKATQINVRVSAAERDVIEAAAAADRRLLSDWTRLVLLRAAKRRRTRKAA